MMIRLARNPVGVLQSLAGVWVLVSLAASVRGEQPATQPAARDTPTPYKLERFSKDEPLWEGWVVRIDLTDPRLTVAIGTGGPDPDGDGPWETILTPTTKIARTNDFDLAINTVFFMNDRKGRPATVKYAEGDPAASTSILASDGKIITQRRTGSPVLFDSRNIASIGTLNAVPPDSKVVVSGNSQIVFRGKSVETKPGGERAPRSAIGTADMGKTLILFVVDGRRESWSVGMTMQELAQTMADLGCDAAVNLDGGGSTTLVAKRPGDTGPVWQTVNTPSDGSQLPIPLSIERPVPYVLGFRWASQAQP
jgi:hypothetical protein